MTCATVESKADSDFEQMLPTNWLTDRPAHIMEILRKDQDHRAKSGGKKAKIDKGQILFNSSSIIYYLYQDFVTS